MLTIRKIFFLVSTMFLVLSQLGALEPGRQDNSKPYSLSFSPSVGLLYGQGEEIVFKYPERNQHLSQLLWDLKPLIYFGLSFNLTPGEAFSGEGLTVFGSAKFGLPLRTGNMENRDWQYTDNENLTNYSCHEAFSQSAVLADISAGYLLTLTDSLVLVFYGQFSFMYLSWMAENGFYQYLETDPITNSIIPGQIWHEDLPKVNIFGPGTRYIQNWFILSPGTALKGRINQHLAMEMNFNYSPLVYCIARDDHLLRDIVFWDTLFPGHYITGSCNLIFTSNSDTEFSFTLSYRSLSGLRGPSYQARTGANQSGQPIRSSSDAGAGFSAIDLSIATRIPLFNRH